MKPAKITMKFLAKNGDVLAIVERNSTTPLTAVSDMVLATQKPTAIFGATLAAAIITTIDA